MPVSTYNVTRVCAQCGKRRRQVLGGGLYLYLAPWYCSKCLKEMGSSGTWPDSQTTLWSPLLKPNYVWDDRVPWATTLGVSELSPLRRSILLHNRGEGPGLKVLLFSIVPWGVCRLVGPPRVEVSCCVVQRPYAMMLELLRSEASRWIDNGHLTLWGVLWGVLEAHGEPLFHLGRITPAQIAGIDCDPVEVVRLAMAVNRSV